MSTEPELSPDQQALLQLVYETFRETAAWPTYLWTERKLDQRTSADLYDTGRAIRGTLIRFDPHRSAASEVMLPVAGVARCDGADQELFAFVATLRWLVLCEQAWEPDPRKDTVRPEVTSEEARAALRREGIVLDSLALARAGALARQEGLFRPRPHCPTARVCGRGCRRARCASTATSTTTWPSAARVWVVPPRYPPMKPTHTARSFRNSKQHTRPTHSCSYSCRSTNPGRLSSRSSTPSNFAYYYSARRYRSRAHL